jgi:hypothetical protein
MTQQEWLACTEPGAMLEFLSRGEPTWKGRLYGWLGLQLSIPRPCIAGDRKLRLFACACCRSIWHRLTDERSRTAVEAAEKFADNPDDTELRSALDKAATAAYAVVGDSDAMTWNAHAAGLASHHTHEPNFRYADFAPMAAAHAAFPENLMMLATQCKLLRDIFGNPFHSVTLNATWLKPNVVKLTQEIYDNCAYDRLPNLGDALEEAGCNSSEVLNHCRGPGPHVRGCWVIDLLLGKG